MERIYYENSLSDVYIFNQMYILPHFHRHIELKFVFDAPVSMTLRGKRYTIKPGGGVIIFPFQTHSYEESTGSRVVRILLAPDRIKSFSPIFRDFVPRDGVFDCEALDASLPGIAKLIRRIMESKADLTTDITTALFTAACGIILEKLPLERVDRRPGRSENVLGDIADWCVLHYREPVKLGQLADALFISERQLSRIFSEQLDISFRAYINSLRIGQVLELLAQTEKPITEIAFESGFESISSFNRVFREVIGCSPGELRARISEPGSTIPKELRPKNSAMPKQTLE